MEIKSEKIYLFRAGSTASVFVYQMLTEQWESFVVSFYLCVIFFF